MSPSRKSLRCASLPPRMAMASIWFVMVATDSNPSRLRSGKPTSTTISTSTPMERATSTGRLLARPPSTNSLPSRSTGSKSPGAERLARIAVTRSPPRSSTGSPVSRSVAIARNGVGNRSKSRTAATGKVRRRSAWVRRWLVNKDFGKRKLPASRPRGKLTRKSLSSLLRRKLRRSRGPGSRNASRHSSENIRDSISAALRPLA